MKKLALLFVVVAATVLSSCGKDEQIDPLWGTWELVDGDFTLRISFAVENTGSIHTVDLEFDEERTVHFTYTVEGNVITIVIDDRTEVWTYSISGNTLTMVGDETLVLTAT